MLATTAAWGSEEAAKSNRSPAASPAGARPAWREAMTGPNTIYDISDNAITDIRYEYPGGQIPTGFSTPDDGNLGTGATMVGYSGGVLFRGSGQWGVMSYGSGGHDTVANQIGCLNLNGERAHYDVWQQPIYSLSPAPGAECYWSPGDAAALPANRRFAYGEFDARKWDKGFPMAIDGWVYSGPMKYNELADEVPTGQYRYAQHCYIPAGFTGLGTGAWFIPGNYMSGPGFRDDPADELCDPADFWPSGEKKWYSHYQREDTRAWGRISDPPPAKMGRGWLHVGAIPGVAGFSTKYKKVIVPAGSDCGAAVFDVSAGIEKGAWSWKECAKAGEWPDPLPGTCAVSNGHPRDRAILVWNGIKTNDPSLNVMDLDDANYSTHVITLPKLKHHLLGESATLNYIPALNKFLAFGINAEDYGHNPKKTIYCQLITIPDNLAGVGAYAVEDVPLKLAPGVELGWTPQMYGKCQYHDRLNCVIFMVVDRPAKAFWLK